MILQRNVQLRSIVMVLTLVLILGTLSSALGSRMIYAERTNLALGKTATASNVFQNKPNYDASRAVDGQASSRWASDTSQEPYWLQVDLGREFAFDQIVISEYQSRMTSYSIQYSSDGTTWNTGSTGTKASGTKDTVTDIDLDHPITGRYVKLGVDTASSGISIYEFEIYGEIPIGGEVMRVTTPNELTEAFHSALPGDTILMANGTWNEIYIDFSAYATAEHPVTLHAETPGKVIISGQSGLSLNRPHLIVDGLLFTDGRAPDGKDSVITFNSDYGRITNTSIVNFNPGDTSTKYYWAFFRGAYNRLDNSRFEGKDHMQPVIGNNGNGNEKYNVVDHSYFKNIHHTNANGMETFRIWGYGGNDELGDDGAYFTIENNLFEHADGDDEVISLKSNHNVVRYNTIVESRGGIVGRSGNTNTIENNIIIGNHYADSTGIRISGHRNTVSQNYVQEVSGVALTLTTGEYVFDENHQLDYLTPGFEPLARNGSPYGYVGHYGWVKDSKITNNVFVNNDGIDISVGIFYKNHWPGYQMVLLPENNLISGNIVYKPNGGTAILTTKQESTSPLDTFKFLPNSFHKNVVFGGGIEINSPNSDKGTIVLPLLGKSVSNSSSQLAEDAIQSYGLKGRGLNSIQDPSDSSGGQKPLMAQDVGPSWMK
ncbi:hypothetical protein PMSM_22160 [Paenibacillus macquariensis subsp. macquariensis]|uniref:F5/8 type C domain-containing protein n=2 Tax=Paenibacillus macquariensis TaxID=948756 RepID=A0ABY1JJA8_9BACL|nr:hypothetical protein PMSM_22160 [Paenibacillus macquariensis subsp. macquariensis]SIQ28562.1 F5/8 type C domain-containing protein [Paenibacillus macquariensis]